MSSRVPPKGPPPQSSVAYEYTDLVHFSTASHSSSFSSSSGRNKYDDDDDDDDDNLVRPYPVPQNRIGRSFHDLNNLSAEDISHCEQHDDDDYIIEGSGSGSSGGGKCGSSVKWSRCYGQ